MRHWTWVAATVLASALCGVARAEDRHPGIGASAFETEVVGLEPEARDALGVRARPLQLAVKRHDGSGVGEPAYASLLAAISAMAKAKGLTVVESGASAPAGTVRVEFDSWFYVEGQKLNADLVRLDSYAEFLRAGKPISELADGGKATNVDVVRVLGGVFGLARGWLPSSFGASMVAHGLRDPAGGSSPAVDRPVADPQQRLHGVRRAVTEVRLEVDDRVFTFQVHATPPPSSPSTVQALVDATWMHALMAVAGHPDQPLVATR